MVSIGRTLADLKVFGREFIRGRIGFFFALVFPIILILLFGAIFSGGSSGPATVYVQNQDGGQVSSAFISALNSTKTLSLVTVPPGQNFTRYLTSHSSSDGIVIPNGFTSDFISGTPVNVTVYGNPTSSTSAVVAGVTAGVVNAFNLQRAHGTNIVRIQTLIAVSKSFKYIDFLIPGLVGFSILTSPMFALVSISSEYKRDKVFKLLSLTPLTRTEWLLSKIIWYIFITVASFLLMYGFGIYFFGAHVVLTVAVIPFLLLGPFLFVSLGMLVGSVSTSVESAAVVGNLITFPMMFLSGTFFPVQSMPTYLQSIAHVLPLFYVIDGLNNVMVYGNDAAALVDIGVLVVTSIIIFALAVRFFKWRED